MIKPLDTSSIMSKPATFNYTFCAAPTVYENNVNYKPSGLKLNLECAGGNCGGKNGKKLNLVG